MDTTKFTWQAGDLRPADESGFDGFDIEARRRELLEGMPPDVREKWERLLEKSDDDDD